MKCDAKKNADDVVDARTHELWNERMVQKYDPDLYHRHQNPVIRWIESRRVREVVRHIPTESRAMILEVGCGGGNVLDTVRAGRLFGVDLSRTILEKAKERLSGRARFLCAAAEHLPFVADRFDCVFCTEVIEHTLDPRTVLMELQRVLRPGGVVILSVP
ncbi:MAG: class I SAM-dependent methyltransferase, partial [bacterium]|nr:class I SAM-dependent methyltransferase [bacterium]